MSIWISKRTPRALILCLALSACLAVGSGALRVRPVLGGAINVAAPAGYCIDPAGVMERNATALALIGRCAGATPATRAILTATVGGKGSGVGIAGQGVELARFFTSSAGRAALSRSGRARTVQVLETLAFGDAFLIRLTDTSPNPYGPGQKESWRAVLGLGGRLVTLTVTGTTAAPLNRDTGRALLGAFLAAMQEANRPAAAG
ncbi:MAG: cation transport ATPase [Paracoccaceae bacterium]|nr:cation transport ATPase [Paracoccaceae bacterium]